MASPVIQAPAQTILIDNFNDDDANAWSTDDRTIGEPYGPGTFDASSGAYHLEGNGLVHAGQGGFLLSYGDPSSDPIFSNGFVRATIRAETEGGIAGIVLRRSTGNNHYWFTAPAINGYFNLEVGAVGDQLSWKAWHAGEPEPESPQWTVTDTTHSSGQLGIIATVDYQNFRQSARVSATFDNIYFTFPEHDDVFAISPYNIYLWAPSDARSAARGTLLRSRFAGKIHLLPPFVLEKNCLLLSFV